MNRSVKWVIPSVYPEHMELILRWLPKRQYEGIEQLVIETNKRPEVNNEMWKLAAKKPSWDINVTTVDPIAMAYAADMPEAFQIFTEVSYGMKLLYPLWVDAPLLITDDDVVMVGDPTPLFEDQPWGTHGGFDGYSKSKKDRRELDVWSDIIQHYLTRDEYNHERHDGGALYHPEVDHQAYRNLIHAMFTSEPVIEASQDPRTRFFHLDHRLPSLWLKTNGGRTLRAPEYRQWGGKVLPKKVPTDGVFIHYNASSNKPKYVRFFHDEADKRGIPRL